MRVTRVDAGRRNPGQRFNLGPKSRGHEVVDQIRADDDQEERERRGFLVRLDLPAERPFVASVLRNRSLSMSPCLLITQAGGELG